jgi:hypothetical protein
LADNTFRGPTDARSAGGSTNVLIASTARCRAPSAGTRQPRQSGGEVGPEAGLSAPLLFR